MPKDFIFSSESVNEGRPDPDFTGERTDKVEEPGKAAGL